MPHRLLTLVAILLLMGGCASAPQTPVEKPQAAVPTTLPTAREDRVVAAAPTTATTSPSADALSARTAAYAQALERILRRTDSTPRAPTQPAAAGPSAFEAGTFRLTLDDGAAANRPAMGVIVVPREAPASRPATPAVAMPVDPPRSSAAAVSADELERRLRQQVRDYPRDMVGQLDLQLLLLLRDEQVPHLPTIGSLAAEDRELVSAVVDALSNLRNAVRADANMLANRKVRPLIEMADRLRAQADLRIPTVSLCTRVDGFGKYEPIEPAKFTAGRENPAILYTEIENFASQLNERKLWETRLTQEAVLYTETGMPVWQDKTPPVVDLARNRRHDFFLVKKIVLPPTLTINRYLLKVSVVDQQANRVAEATMPVQIVAQ